MPRIRSLMLLLFFALPVSAADSPLKVTVSGAQNRGLTVSVAMTVQQSGGLSAVVIDQSSGNRGFDAVVLHTIMSAAPNISAQKIQGLEYDASTKKFMLPSW